MKFNMPTASRKRLEELLEYLAQPCEKYPGNRAEDFKKCFDVESKWCWKYADLVLRTLKPRTREKLGCSPERHHIIPFCFLKENGYTGCRWTQYDSERNVGYMHYGEHIMSHYLMAMCGKGSIPGKMALSFWRLFKGKRRGWGRTLPTIEFVMEHLGEAEARRMLGMIDSFSKVEKEGRTHYAEDPAKARKDYYEMRGKFLQKERKSLITPEEREKQNRKRREDRKNNPDKFRERDRKRYARLKESGKARERYEKYRNPEREKQYNETYKPRANELNRKARKDPVKGKIIRERDKAKYIKHRDYKLGLRRQYREKYPEKVKEQKHNSYMNHKEEVKEKSRTYRAAKKAAGFKEIRDRSTGTRHWVFVGLPESPESTKVA